MFKLLPAALLFAAACPAQQVRQQALGFVFDPGSASVRPLWGVPGAAYVGGALDLGVDIASSAASPRQDYLVLLTGPTRAAQIWLHDTQIILALPGVRPGATSVVVSPEGASAAFFYADTNQVHVITGLPSSPLTAFDANLSAMMNPLASLAISDDGTQLLASEIAVAGNAAPAVAVFQASGVAGRIPVASPASAIAFLSGNHDALISAGSEAVLIRDAAAQSSRIPLPSAANSAVGVVASSDGQRAFFAVAQSGSVAVVSLTSATAQPLIVDCNCVPTAISRTAADSIYRLTGSSGSPVSLMDVSTSQPRLLLIPPAVSATPGNQ